MSPIAYADDLAIVVQNKTQISKAIATLESWSAQNNMQVNKLKSGILALNKRRALLSTSEKHGYPQVDTYKYLGIETRGNDCTKNYFQRIRRKVFCILAKIKHVSDQMTWKKRISLVRTLVVPLVDQVGPLAMTTNKAFAELTRTLQRRATRVILGFGANTKNEIVEMFMSTDRRTRWKARLNAILQRWEEKQLT